MRKFFTSLVACALLVVSGGFASAQQSLSKAEQDAIKMRFCQLFLNR